MNANTMDLIGLSGDLVEVWTAYRPDRGDLARDRELRQIRSRADVQAPLVCRRTPRPA